VSTWTFQDSQWRQGSVIPRELVPEGILPSETAQEAILIVVSHDCDIVQSGSAEPFIEFVIAHPRMPEQKDGMLFRCKNPRKLQLWIRRNGALCLYEISAHDRYRVARESIKGSDPEPSLLVDERDIQILAEWVARRYKRYSFPTEFNRRIPEKTLGKIKKALTTHGEDVQLFMALSSFGELSTEQIYDALVRVVIPSEAMDDDFRQQRALKVVSAFLANLTACPGINLIDVKLESRADFTLEDQDATVEWNQFDYLSLVPGPEPNV